METPEIDADFALVISGISMGGNLPPYTPSGPDPAQGAVEVDIHANMSWNGGDPNTGDSVYYDVYFDTSAPPAFLERCGEWPPRASA